VPSRIGGFAPPTVLNANDGAARDLWRLPTRASQRQAVDARGERVCGPVRSGVGLC
jgi:hypothetical protein